MTTQSALFAGLALVAATVIGCGAGDGASTDAQQTTSVPGAPTTDVVATDDRPVAPDFALTLQPEGEFVLSESGKPVYLVFWAEW